MCGKPEEVTWLTERGRDLRQRDTKGLADWTREREGRGESKKACALRNTIPMNALVLHDLLWFHMRFD